MNKYEFTFLLPEETDAEAIKKILEAANGKVLEEQKWGKKPLAYPINKLYNAYYTTWMINMEAKDVTEFKKKLNFNEILMRYLLLKVE